MLHKHSNSDLGLDDGNQESKGTKERVDKGSSGVL